MEEIVRGKEWGKKMTEDECVCVKYTHDAQKQINVLDSLELPRKVELH